MSLLDIIHPIDLIVLTIIPALIMLPFTSLLLPIIGPIILMKSVWQYCEELDQGDNDLSKESFTVIFLVNLYFYGLCGPLIIIIHLIDFINYYIFN